MERKDFIVGKKYQHCSNPKNIYTCAYAGSEMTILVNDTTRVEYSITRPNRWVEYREKIVRYVNINFSKIPGKYFAGCSYKSRAAADAGATSNRVACVRIEFKEGQYDE